MFSPRNIRLRGEVIANYGPNRFYLRRGSGIPSVPIVSLERESILDPDDGYRQDLLGHHLFYYEGHHTYKSDFLSIQRPAGPEALEEVYSWDWPRTLTPALRFPHPL